MQGRSCLPNLRPSAIKTDTYTHTHTHTHTGNKNEAHRGPWGHPAKCNKSDKYCIISLICGMLKNKPRETVAWWLPGTEAWWFLGTEEWGEMGSFYPSLQTSGIRWINSGNLMYSRVTTGTNPELQVYWPQRGDCFWAGNGVSCCGIQIHLT